MAKPIVIVDGVEKRAAEMQENYSDADIELMVRDYSDEEIEEMRLYSEAQNYSDEEIEKMRIDADIVAETYCLFDVLRDVYARIESMDSNLTDPVLLQKLDDLLAKKEDTERQLDRVRQLRFFNRTAIVKDSKTKKAQQIALSLAAKAKKKAEAKTASEPVQLNLDIWPDTVRGVPNSLLRGALFSIESSRSHALKKVKLETIKGIEIWFKNERWNQTDLDVWEALIHLARLNTDGKVAFKMNQMLTHLGVSKAGSNAKAVDESIVRLAGGLVEIHFTEQGKIFGGSFISSYYKNEATAEIVVEINPKMKSLYEAGYSWVDYQQRQRLGKSALAKWMHGFISTHAYVHPFKLETLQKLCGSTCEIGEFRRSMRIALEKNKEIGAIVSWDIGSKNNKDLVSVVRAPSIGQKKFIEGQKNSPS